MPTKKKKRTRAAPPPKDSISKLVGWPWPLRPMQQDAWDQFDNGIRRFGLFWHRRAGKDVFGMSVARNQMASRIGTYVHFFPKHVHAKRALWRGIDPRKGAKFIDIAFGDIEADRNNQDMLIEAMNGSTWTLQGSDNYDSNIIGGNVVGVVFSEWALCNPNAWDYIRPILRENNGWAMFITTFRGRNHAWQMYKNLQDNKDWYIDKRDITQTTELDGSPIISLEDVEKDRSEGMKESLIQQEYFCNPKAIAEGAIYGKQVEQLNLDTTRQQAVWNPNKPVYAVWNFDLPIFAACVYVQPGAPNVILGGWTEEDLTLGEAIARCYRQPFPIQNHLISSAHQEMVPLLADLDVYPDVMHDPGDFMRTSTTAGMLGNCIIAGDKCDTVMDALGGYVRKEHFSSQAADLVFSPDPVYSWHMQLSEALETWATWDYHAQGNTWTQKPDYSVQDRIARIIP
jgi:hypothetical protein